MPYWLISIVCNVRKLPMYQINRDLVFMHCNTGIAPLHYKIHLLAKSSWMSAQSSILLQKFKWKNFICT